MPFNNEKNGFENEIDFINAINDKKMNKLSLSLRLFIQDLFGEIDEESIINCKKNINLQKYDIIIEVNKKLKRISIKKGVKNSVHTEPITEFIHFLIQNKMPKSLIINFLQYHYADGSTNGKGEKRITIDEYKKEHQKEIDKINNFINQDKLLYKAIDRFIIRGRNSNNEIDAIIYGVPEDFIWIKKDDIYKILLSKKNNYSTSIHFSSLTYQPLDRNIIRNPKYENKRYISQIKWYNLSDCIIENMNNNISNNIESIVESQQADYVGK